MLPGANRSFELATASRLQPWLEVTRDALILGSGRWNGVWTIPRGGLAAALSK
jgi:hypothetical protein